MVAGFAHRFLASGLLSEHEAKNEVGQIAGRESTDCEEHTGIACIESLLVVFHEEITRGENENPCVETGKRNQQRRDHNEEREHENHPFRSLVTDVTADRVMSEAVEKPKAYKINTQENSLIVEGNC